MCERRFGAVMGTGSVGLFATWTSKPFAAANDAERLRPCMPVGSTARSHRNYAEIACVICMRWREDLANHFTFRGSCAKDTDAD